MLQAKSVFNNTDLILIEQFASIVDQLSFSINRLVKHNLPLHQSVSEASVNVDSDDEDNNNTYNHNNNIDDETELKGCRMMAVGQMSPESGRGGKSHSRCSSRSRYESRSGSESPELEVDSPPASPALRIQDERRLMSHTILVSNCFNFDSFKMV